MTGRKPIDLSEERALIFRITHFNNLAWFLDNGIPCRSHKLQHPRFISIGNSDLIMRRKTQLVTMPPGGPLSNYIPFYFTPLSIMLMNINTGYRGVTKVPNEELVTIVTSLHRLIRHKVDFLFTDLHASAIGHTFYNDIKDLNVIDWGILKNKDFGRDPEDPRKLERYQAEALVHSFLPVEAVIGIGCSCDKTADAVRTLIEERELTLQTLRRPGWYF